MESKKKHSFGKILKDLRKKKGLSIKKLGSELDITYSYISKLENCKSIPSNEFIEKVADHFGYDPEELLIRAGKIPEDILSILSNNPIEAIEFLRNKFQQK
jgi:transcriptional regulator with XRE-family HTH domain